MTMNKRERLPTPVFWPEEFYWLYNLRGRKESYTTEWLSISLHFKTNYNARNFRLLIKLITINQTNTIM